MPEHAPQPAAGRDLRTREEPAAAPPAIASAARALALQRRIGNRATARLLARDTVTMPAETVTSTRGTVEQAVGGLGALRGVGVDPTAMSVAHGEESVQRNSPRDDRPLPFNGSGGWDAAAILTALGQYDVNAGTDSDALRCVQAVALASRIVQGPMAVRSLLSAAALDGMLSGSMDTRRRTALAVLRHVRERIGDGRATFGDLSWAQEALHDLFYNDVGGTPLTDIHRRIAPVFDLTFTSEERSTWLATPEEVLAEAGRLAEGEQFLLNTWQVVFNQAFDQLEEQGIVVPEGGSQVVNINGRRVRLRRIDTSSKPAPGAIDPHRDTRSGHQLLIINSAAVGGLRLYEPEITESGRHLEPLTAEVLRRYFRDHPEIGIYNYMQILGKLAPSTFGRSSWPGAGGP